MSRLTDTIQARDLGLEDRILMTSKNSVAAQNRFIYYPDHLVRMPGPGSSLLQNLSNVLSEPIFKGTIPGALSEITKLRRSGDLQDESIGSFLTRRFGSALADNVVSAVYHGIYAGDIYKLSARAILPSLWAIEWRNNSIIKGLLEQEFGGMHPIATSDLDMMKTLESQPIMSDKLEAVKKSSVFTFKGGIGELADRLEAKLDESDNVLILEKTDVRRIKLRSSPGNEKVWTLFMIVIRAVYFSVRLVKSVDADSRELDSDKRKRGLKSRNDRLLF